MRGWLGFNLFPGFFIALPVRARTIIAGLLVLLALVGVFVVIGAGILIHSDTVRPDFGPTENAVPSRIVR